MPLPVNNSSSVLEKQLTDYLARQSATVAVSLYVLNTHRYLGINDAVSMHAASTMKIPVMLEVFRQSTQGKFKLSDSLPLKNEFRSLAGGAVYSLNREEDSARRLYDRLGQEESILELLEEMIVRSGNLATNLLMERVGVDSIQESMRRLGATHINILRGVENNAAYRAGLNNTTTARDLTIILQALAEGQAADEESTGRMIELLSRQEFNDKIPAGLPAGIRIAHKTGSIPGFVEHDTGIVYPADGNAYILTVLTRSFTEAREANRCIADISRMVYQEVLEAGLSGPLETG